MGVSQGVVKNGENSREEEVPNQLPRPGLILGVGFYLKWDISGNRRKVCRREGHINRKMEEIQRQLRAVPSAANDQTKFTRIGVDSTNISV